MKGKIALATLAMIPMTANNAYASNIGTVTASSLNVRSGPSTSYTVVTTVKKNDKVNILQSSNGWYKIETSSGKQGWVSSSYISASNSNTNNSTNNNTQSNIAIVNTDGLNFRNGAGTSYSIIKVLNKGEKVEVISESNGWSKVKHDSRLGYVASQYIDKATTNYTIKEVNTDGLNVRKGPSTSYESIGKIDKGTSVEVISESDGWSKINYKNTTAYVATRYLNKISSNEQVPPVVGGESTENVSGATIYYKALNYTLQNHVDAQYKKALEGGNVISSSISRMSEELTTSMPQSRAFVTPSKADLEYYLNPKNFTNSDKGMMQFLRLDTYKGGITESELNSYLNSLPKVNGKNTVFYNQGKAFINAAQKYDIDLVYLVSHAMWETGYGKSVLAQGQTITSYKGKPLDKPVTVYNFFGIGAIDKSANVSGAEASYSNGWTSIEKTIEGSAKWISANYIKSSKYNQNTIYKMKFNYDYIWHQYATDVNWANSIGRVMNNIVPYYDGNAHLEYLIPKYK